MLASSTWKSITWYPQEFVYNASLFPAETADWSMLKDKNAEPDELDDA